MPIVKKEKCVGCGRCVSVCPVAAIFIKDDKAIIDQEKCINCGKCLTICPYGAIQRKYKNHDKKQS